MNKRDLKQLSKSELIKLLLEPITNNPVLNQCRDKLLFDCNIESELMNLRKSKLINYLLKKKTRKFDLQEKTHNVYEYFPGMRIIYKADLIVENADKK